MYYKITFNMLFVKDQLRIQLVNAILAHHRNPCPEGKVSVQRLCRPANKYGTITLCILAKKRLSSLTLLLQPHQNSLESRTV